MQYKWLEIRLPEGEQSQSFEDAYDQLHRSALISMSDSFYDWILDLADVRPNQQVLDAAGGIGALSRRARFRNVSVVTFDLSYAALQRANSKRALGNGQCLPFAGCTFDRVTSIGSLEHYVDPLAGARELHRVLNEDGQCLVLLPNLYSLLSNIWHAYRIGDAYVDRQPIQRYAGRADWQHLLEAAGFDVQRVLKYECETPRHWHDVIWYFSHGKRLVRLLLTPFVPTNLANCFVFLCKK